MALLFVSKYLYCICKDLNFQVLYHSQSYLVLDHAMMPLFGRVLTPDWCISDLDFKVHRPLPPTVEQRLA